MDKSSRMFMAAMVIVIKIYKQLGPSSVKEWGTKLKQHNVIYLFKMLNGLFITIDELMYVISNLSP